VNVLVRGSSEAVLVSADLGLQRESFIVRPGCRSASAHWTLVVAAYVNWSAALVALVPPALATVTSTLPAAAAAGDSAVIDPSSLIREAGRGRSEVDLEA